MARIIVQRDLYPEGAEILANAVRRTYKVEIEVMPNEYRGKGFYDPSLKMLVAVGEVMPITEICAFIRGFIVGQDE